MFTQATFNGIDIQDAEGVHPLKGATGRIIGRFTMTQAGYNTLVRVPAGVWCKHMARIWGGKMAALEAAREQEWVSEDGQYIDQEANFEDELIVT